MHGETEGLHRLAPAAVASGSDSLAATTTTPWQQPPHHKSHYDGLGPGGGEFVLWLPGHKQLKWLL